MTTHVYTAEEIAPLSGARAINSLALSHGYTGVSVTHTNDFDGENYAVTVDQVDDKASVLANLELATLPGLEANTVDLVVAGDAVAIGTLVISDVRGPGAAGVKIDVTLPPNEIVFSPTPSVLLDDQGQASFQFGPSSLPGVVSGRMLLVFSYASGEGAPLRALVSYA